MKNITTISERLLQMIDYLNVSTNDFAKKIGYNRSQAIYDVINRKSKPSFDFFEKLYNSEYSDIFNSEWLLTGTGPMLKSNIFPSDTSMGINYKDLAESRLETIELLREKIDSLNEKIHKLEGQGSSVPEGAVEFHNK